MELDSLEIKIQATATKANNAIDNMITRLEKLSGTLNSINGTSLSGLANGVNRLATAMQAMKNVGTADFTRLAKNITKWICFQCIIIGDGKYLFVPLLVMSIL